MAYASENTKIRRLISLLNASEAADGAFILTDTDLPSTAAAPGSDGAIGFTSQGRILSYATATGVGASKWSPGVGYLTTIPIGNVATSGTATLPAEIAARITAGGGYALVSIESVTGTPATRSAVYAVSGTTLTVTANAAPGVGNFINVHVAIF